MLIFVKKKKRDYDNNDNDRPYYFEVFQAITKSAIINT